MAQPRTAAAAKSSGCGRGNAATLTLILDRSIDDSFFLISSFQSQKRCELCVIYRTQSGESNGTICKRLRLPEVPKIEYGTRRIRVQRLACRTILASAELLVHSADIYSGICEEERVWLV